MGIFTQLWKKQYLLLAFMLLSSVLPTFAADDDLITEQVIAYSPLEEDESIGSNKDKITNLTIFAELDDSDMKFLREMKHLEFLDLSRAYLLTTNLALDDAKELKQIILPYMEQTEWNNISFCNCSSLASFDLPEDVSQISDKAFSGCRSLTTFNIPWSVTNIGKEAFSNCSGLKSIYIPGEVSQISDGTFSGCSSLTTIRLSKWVTNINSKAFEGCKSLKSIYCHSNILADPTAFDGVDKEKCIVYVPTGLADTYRKNDAWKAFKNIVEYDADADEVSIVTGSGSVGETLAEVTGNKKDKIVSLNIAGDLNEDDLECIREMKDHLQFLNLRYAYCQNLDLNFKDFKKMQQITLPTISFNIDVTFINCSSLTSINIPEGIQIGKEAFSGCSSLMSISIPNGVTQINDGTFSDCRSLASVKISKNTTAIGDKAFSGCSSLTSIYFPLELAQIGNEAFSNCSSLTSVRFPDGLKLNDQAFAGCKSLENIYCQENVLAAPTVFDGVNKEKCTVYVPIGFADTYKEQENWNMFKNIIESYDANLVIVDLSVYSSLAEAIGNRKSKIDNLKIIGTLEDSDFELIREMKEHLLFLDISQAVVSGRMSFKDCKVLQKIQLPELSYINDECFYGCYSLSSINIPDGVIEIGDESFYNCQSLTSVYIPESVVKIGAGAFAGCSNLKSVNIPEAVMKINDWCFAFCRSLTSIKIPEWVKEIGAGAFQYCSNLKSVNIPKYVSKINDECFYECSSLSSINIPDGVTKIGSEAFASCYSLTSVNIPKSVGLIGVRAFSGCLNLKTVRILGKVEVGSEAFSSRNLQRIEFLGGISRLGQNIFLGWDDSNDDLDIYINSVVPPQTGSYQFAPADYNYLRKILLYVPRGAARAYKKAEYWNEFIHFIEYDFDKLTGIDKVTTDSDNQGENYEVARYSINGLRLNAPTQGINIVKYSDGTTKKVMVP
mgnify:CR=1 FL=1